MNGYIVGFKGKKIEIRANSLYEAKTKALIAFKPSKKDLGLVWVMLAEKDGEPATHSTNEL